LLVGIGAGGLHKGSLDATATGTSLPQFDSTTRDTAVGMTAPTLDSVNFAGQSVQVGGATGKPYALVFLAHWCPHCQAEVPRLVELAKDGVFDGVKVSAVATSTSEEAPNYPPSAWLQDEDWSFPVLADSKTGTSARAYGLTAFPYFVLVDADGTVAGRGTGELPEDQIKANIKALKAGDELPISSSSKSSSAG